jgi:uncharacterized protein
MKVATALAALSFLGGAAAVPAGAQAPLVQAPGTVRPMTVNPSFDCSGVRHGSIEELICGEPLLAALDVELARLYKLATVPASGDASAMQRAQERWIEVRNACAGKKTSAVCARDRYVDRIDALRTQSNAARSADDKGISLGPFAYTCGGITGTVRATFVNADTHLARVQNGTRVWIMVEQLSGSGARYESSTGGAQFWSHGRDALFRAAANGPDAQCHPQAIG